MDLTLEIIRVIGALGLVLAILFALVHGLRRWGVLDKFGSQDTLLDVIARKSMGPKNQIVIVRAHERFFLLGVSPQGIRCLSELSDVETASFNRVERTSPESGKSGFGKAQL